MNFRRTRSNPAARKTQSLIVRRNLHDALSNLCGRGLMNHIADVVPEIIKTIDGLGTGKAGTKR
jgi:hypothetical protein